MCLMWQTSTFLISETISKSSLFNTINLPWHIWTKIRVNILQSVSWFWFFIGSFGPGGGVNCIFIKACHVWNMDSLSQESVFDTNKIFLPPSVLIRWLNSWSEHFLSLLTPSDGRHRFNILIFLRRGLTRPTSTNSAGHTGPTGTNLDHHLELTRIWQDCRVGV